MDISIMLGTSPGVKPLMRGSALFDSSRDVRKSVVIISDFGPFECATCPMFRTAGVAPNNLFANTLNAWKEFVKRGLNQPTSFHSWAFNASAPTSGVAVKGVNVPYTSGTVSWKYNSTTGLWARSISGVPHTDKDTGKQLTANNVIVVYAYHAVTLIQEDVSGAKSIQIQLWGQAPVQVFRDGRMLDGNWKRPAQPNAFELVDGNGQPITLKPGNTWIEVVPLSFPVKATT